MTPRLLAASAALSVAGALRRMMLRHDPHITANRDADVTNRITP